MKANEIRKKFLDFFEKKGHKIVPSSSLIPADSSVLFTTAGMQQFKEYYLDKKSPYGENVASCQKCFRTSDIEEVGDENHLTFLEMLGNFSFGGYFKKETIEFAFEFLISELKLPISEMKVTIFKGDKEVPQDTESIEIWKEFGFRKEKGNLDFKGREDNFWGPTGEEGPCGPTTEIYFRDLEIWNLVFNEYYQDRNKILTPLKKKGVDTGMGLERLAMVLQNKNSVYETDLFLPIIKEIRNFKKETKGPKLDQRSERIIADHIKSAVFIIVDGITPLNIGRGYVLRRILRRAIRYGKFLNLIPLAQKVIEIYKNIYPEVSLKEVDILAILQDEEEKFVKTLSSGLKKIKSEIENYKLKKSNILPGKIIFDLYQTYGFPLELTKELAQEEKMKIDEKGFKKEFEKHQKLSRTASCGMFKSGLVEINEKTIKYHTATHLLHQALREVLGGQIVQKGSNITSERLRFDFSYPQKMTKEEIKKVENIVNQKIKEDLKVDYQEMGLEEAKNLNALGIFEEKYKDKINVYFIGNFSKEICAGPHVDSTSRLGHFEIIKEESSGAGVRRIRAILN